MPAIQLPAPLNVFPVKIPYYVRSDMYKMGKNLHGIEEHNLFMVDSDYETTVKACLYELQNYPDHARIYLDDDIEALKACLWDAAQSIANDQPQYATFDGEIFESKLLGLSLGKNQHIQFDRQTAIFPDLGAICYEHLKPLSHFDRLCDVLRLSVQEDLVIGKVNDDKDVMECLLVPLPNKWSPQEKLGLSFAGTHAVIPRSEKLVENAPRLVDAIMTKGPFMRYNWSLASEHLAQNPDANSDYKNAYEEIMHIDDFDTMMKTVHFRVERQTLIPYPHHNRYLFVIHTYTHSLAEVLTTNDRKQQLLDVLQSIPGNVLPHRSIASSVITLLASHIEALNARTS